MAVSTTSTHAWPGYVIGVRLDGMKASASWEMKRAILSKRCDPQGRTSRRDRLTATPARDLRRTFECFSRTRRSTRTNRSVGFACEVRFGRRDPEENRGENSDAYACECERLGVEEHGDEARDL